MPFKSPFYWLGLGVTILFGEVILGSGIAPSVAIPLTFIVGVISGFLSGRCAANGKN